MPILRDVLARFAVSVDDAPLTRLDRKINTLKERVAAFAGYAATGFSVAAYGGYQLVSAASDANEALNVLTRTFGDQTQSVLTWSDTTSKAMGRSKYDLQKAAGTFGAFLEPQFKGTGQNIAHMSKELTQLSVDLASFYNISDQEASMRLFSGLSGETEAVRRLGVDISDTSLDAFNKVAGDPKSMHKRVAALSLQEKTQHRYRKILADTVTKQNDAVLTRGQWANSLKEAQGRAHDLAVELGQGLIPVAHSLLQTFNAVFGPVSRALKAWKSLTERTTLLASAVKFAAVAVALLSVQQGILALSTMGVIPQLLAQAAAFAKIAYSMAKWGVLFLVVEDFYHFLQGNESIIGQFLAGLWGAQDPLRAMNDRMEEIVESTINAIAALRTLSQVQLTGAKLFAGMDLLQILESNGYQSPGTNAKVRDTARTSQFDTAARGGDFKEALKHKGDQETGPQAAVRAAGMRRDYLTTHPDEVKPTEYASGFAVWSPQTEHERGRSSPTMQVPILRDGTAMTVTIHVDGVKDPGATAEAVRKEVQKMEDERQARFQSTIRSASASTRGAASGSP